MNFPSSISLTLTNHCNLRCEMCGQWSDEGYIRSNTEVLSHEISLEDWKRVVDELSEHGIRSLLLRGGEVFMLPGIIELLEYIHARGMFISIDTNGTMLEQYAAPLLRIGNIHLTVSVDGTESVHDRVRGMPGTFSRIKAGLSRLVELEAAGTTRISRSICFTISCYNYFCLGDMPDVARSLGIGSIAIVPYYYFPELTGRQYARELKALGCKAFTCQGFHHEDSGVEVEEFLAQYHRYLSNLGEIQNYPYMPLNEEEYRTWFSNSNSPVGPEGCMNVENLIDIQPDGSANFCVDFIDYSFGNIREASIETLWNSERAGRFRSRRRQTPLAVCYRCGAKYMSQAWGEYESRI